MKDRAKGTFKTKWCYSYFDVRALTRHEIAIVLMLISRYMGAIFSYISRRRDEDGTHKNITANAL
jgi:hypothetical protein